MCNTVVVQDVSGANISLTTAVKKSKLFLQVSYLHQLNSIICINYSTYVCFAVSLMTFSTKEI